MTGREAFLAETGWADAASAPLAGDASARRYWRLRRQGSGASAILMQAPPDPQHSNAAFVALARYLRATGLSAPKVLAAERANGLMLLEDLGDTLFSRILDTDGPGAAAEPYLAAVDVLAALAQAAPPPGLAVMDPPRMAAMTGIGFRETGQQAAAKAALAEMAQLFARHLARPPVPVLRDVHAENLLWLPERDGLRRVGLLDFQDAVLGPPGYDLVSLLDDARRDLPPALKDLAARRYGMALGIDAPALTREMALLSVQRNLRIAGVFLNLARQQGKPGYLVHLPRVAGHVRRALTHPDLASLRAHVAPLLDAAEVAA